MVEKITLTPLDSNRRPETSKKLTADFNPESLRMSRSRLGGSGAQRSNASGTAQASAEQTTGMSATLSLELLFDTSRTGKNVQNTTLQIAGMLGPVDTSGTETQVTLVQIQWGAFLFNGSINSMEETLDLFSDQGVPLRSTVSLSLTEVQLEAAEAARRRCRGRSRRWFWCIGRFQRRGECGRLGRCQCRLQRRSVGWRRVQRRRRHRHAAVDAGPVGRFAAKPLRPRRRGLEGGGVRPTTSTTRGSCRPAPCSTSTCRHRLVLQPAGPASASASAG